MTISTVKHIYEEDAFIANSIADINTSFVWKGREVLEQEIKRLDNISFPIKLKQLEDKITTDLTLEDMLDKIKNSFHTHNHSNHPLLSPFTWIDGVIT